MNNKSPASKWWKLSVYNRKTKEVIDQYQQSLTFNEAAVAARRLRYNQSQTYDWEVVEVSEVKEDLALSLSNQELL